MSSVRIEKKKRHSITSINQNNNFEKNIKDGLNIVVKNFSNSKIHENNKFKKSSMVHNQHQQQNSNAMTTSVTTSRLPIKTPIPNTTRGNETGMNNSKIRNFKTVLEKFDDNNYQIPKGKITIRNKTPINVIYEKCDPNTKGKSETSSRIPRKIKTTDDTENRLPCTNDLCSKVRQLARINLEANRVKTKVSQMMTPIKDYRRILHSRQMEVGNRYSKRNLKSQRKKEEDDYEKNTMIGEQDSDISTSTESIRFETPDDNYNYQTFSRPLERDIQEWEQYYDCNDRNNSCRHELEAKFSSNTSSAYCDVLTDYTSYDEVDESIPNNMPIPKSSSANMLIHFRELLNQYDLEKLSNSNSTTLLSEDDVNLLRKLIEADEKYCYLKQKDRKLLKEMLLVQQCEVQAKERVLEQTLRNLRKAIKSKVPVNAHVVEKINKIIDEFPIKYPRKSFSSGDASVLMRRNKYNTLPSHFYRNHLEKLEEIIETSPLNSVRNQTARSELKDTEPVVPVNSETNMKEVEVEVTVERKTPSLPAEEVKEDELTNRPSEIIPCPIVKELESISSIQSIIPYPSLSEITSKSTEPDTKILSTSVYPIIPSLNLEPETSKHDETTTIINGIIESSKLDVEVIFKDITTPKKGNKIPKSISARLEKSDIKQNLRATRSLDYNFPISKSSKNIQTEHSEKPTIYNPININNLLRKLERIPIKWCSNTQSYITYSVQPYCLALTLNQPQMYRIRYLSIEALKYAGDVLVQNPESENFELKMTNFEELRKNPDQLFSILQPVSDKSVKIITLDNDSNFEDEFKYTQMNPWKSKSPHNIPIKKDSRLKQLAINMLRSFKDSMKLEDLSDYELAKMVDKKILTNKKNATDKKRKKQRNINVTKDFEEDPIKVHRRLLFQIIQVFPILVLLFTFLLPEIRCI